MTDQSKIFGYGTPDGMSTVSSESTDPSHALLAATVRMAADMIAQAMFTLGQPIGMPVAQAPHVFACALGHLVGRMAAIPEYGADFGAACGSLEEYADKLGAQVRENVLLTAMQYGAHVAPGAEVEAAIREAAARGAAGEAKH